MQSYRFIGDVAEIHGTPYKFTRFGQLVELPEPMAERACLEGACIIPAAMFDELGFDPADLKKYSRALLHSRAPAEFRAKADRAREVLRVYRETLRKQG